jgi:hypothetical protein
MLLLFFLSHLDLPFELISAFFLTVNLGDQTKVFQKVIFVSILGEHFKDSNHFGVLRIDQGMEERSIVILNEAEHGVLPQNLLLELSDLVDALFELPVNGGTILVLVNIENALVVVLLRARVVLVLLLVLQLGLGLSLGCSFILIGSLSPGCASHEVNLEERHVLWLVRCLCLQVLLRFLLLCDNSLHFLLLLGVFELLLLAFDVLVIAVVRLLLSDLLSQSKFFFVIEVLKPEVKVCALRILVSDGWRVLVLNAAVDVLVAGLVVQGNDLLSLDVAKHLQSVS